MTVAKLAKPLVLIDKRLATLAPEKGKSNVFRVVVLNVGEQGRRIQESDPVALPQWANIGTGLDHDGEGRSFNSRARLLEGDVLVKWSAGTWYHGGANPPLELLEASNKNAAGIAQINLDSRKVEMLADDKQPFADAGPRPVDKLPKQVQEVAQREKWRFGHVIGPRVYGQVQKGPDVSYGLGGLNVDIIQAVDLETGKLLWERPFEEKLILPPPP